MRLTSAVLMYLCTALGANADPAALEALREGDMRKLVVHETPAKGSEAVFLSETGDELRLSDYAGKVVLVNFWATWCAPCRKEMPHLAALQEALSGEDFEVLTIATGRNPPEAIARFLEEIGASALPRHVDPRQKLAREMGVLGLPVTLLLNREGQEVARLQGDADWSGESARAIIEAVMAGG